MAHTTQTGSNPAHVAIIMDGNGRWATQRGQPRSAGHKAGVKAVRLAVKSAIECGITHLTLFAFSTENWNRPKAEVAYLMQLIRVFIRSDLMKLKNQGVRVQVIGERDQLDASIRTLIDEAEQKTQENTKLTLIIAFNYGGRDEIVRAVKRIVERAVHEPTILTEIDEACVARHLDTGSAHIPDVDLLIRTGGEERISNFLLWQCAYAEFVFFDAYWPDFDGALFRKALQTYRARDRRFGTITAAPPNGSSHAAKTQLAASS